MRDDNDRLRDGTLPNDPLADAAPMDDPAIEGDSRAGEYRPFPVAAFPDPVRSFLIEAAAATGCDPAYLGLCSLAGLTASIGNTRRIKLKRSWCEPAVVWTGIVGESGTLKSPALDLALSPLRRLQGKAIDRYLVEKKAYDEKRERYIQNSRSRKRNQPGEDLIPPDRPVPWRILCSDVTVEALAGILEYSPRGLLLERDELSGWIKGFDQYKKGQGADAAHFLSMHRAGELLVDRKTNMGIIHVPRAALSVTGGIQPMILKRALGKEHLDNGLAARLLLAMPPRQPKRWSDAEISPSTALRFSELYDCLLNLDFGIDQDGSKIPIDLPLTESGLESWIDFYNLHGEEQGRLEGNLAAAFSKLEGYCARFALVIHLIRAQTEDPALETDYAIDSASISAGVTLTRWFAYETERVYQVLGIAPTAPAQSSLEEIIRQNGGRISARDLMQASRKYRGSAEKATAALNELVHAGLGKWVSSNTGRPGRSAKVFVLLQEGGNSGNGNAIAPTDGGSSRPVDEIATSYGRQATDISCPQAGNTMPNSVTGEEVSPL